MPAIFEIGCCVLCAAFTVLFLPYVKNMISSFFELLDAMKDLCCDALRGLAQDDEKSRKVDVNKQAEFDISYALDKNNFNWYNIIYNSQNDIDSVMSRTVVPWQNKEPNIMITPQVRVHGPEGIIIPGPMAIPRPDFREGTEILVPPEVKGPQVHIFPKAEPKSMDDMVMTSEGGSKTVENALPNLEKATINPNKLTGYALNPEHPVGGNKAKVFESALGYNKSNADDLIQQVYEKLPQSEAILGTLDQYGQRYTVNMPITGPNGNTVNVRTGWIIKTGSDAPELTTIYVK